MVSRYVCLGVLCVCLSFLACTYDSRPPNGAMACGPAGTEKRCPDGYACFVGPSSTGCANTCWLVGQQPASGDRCPFPAGTADGEADHAQGGSDGAVDGSQGGGDGSVAGLHVLSVAPADKTQNVAPGTTVTITFSQALDPSSVTAANIKVGVGSNSVSGNLVYANGTVTFTPASRLDLLTTYTLTVSGAVTSATGSPLGADFQSQFTVRDGAWTALPAPQAAGVLISIGNRPLLAEDGQGNVLVAWSEASASQGAATPQNIVARRYVRGTGWETAKTLVNLRGDVLSGGMNSSGDAVVAWSQLGSASPELFAIQYRGGSWEPGPTPLTGAVDESRGIAAGMSPIGEAHVIWAEDDPTSGNVSVFSRVATTAGTWGSFSLNVGIAGDYCCLNGFPLAFEPGGNALVFWTAEATDFTNPQLSASRYLASSGSWSPAMVPGTASASVPIAAAFDATGNAIAVWPGTSGAGSGLYFNTFSKTSGWSPASLAIASMLAQPGPDAHAVFDGADYVVTWTDVTTIANRLAVRYSGGAWGPSTLVSSGDSPVSDGGLVADRHGNLLAVWAQSASSSTSDLGYARYAKESSQWASPGTAGNPGPGSCPTITALTGCAQVVMADDGSAAALRFAFDGSTGLANLYVSVFE